MRKKFISTGRTVGRPRIPKFQAVRVYKIKKKVEEQHGGIEFRRDDDTRGFMIKEP